MMWKWCTFYLEHGMGLSYFWKTWQLWHVWNTLQHFGKSENNVPCHLGSKRASFCVTTARYFCYQKKNKKTDLFFVLRDLGLVFLVWFQDYYLNPSYWLFYFNLFFLSLSRSNHAEISFYINFILQGSN